MTTCPTCGTVINETIAGAESQHGEAISCIRALGRRLAALEENAKNRPTLTFVPNVNATAALPPLPFQNFEYTRSKT